MALRRYLDKEGKYMWKKEADAPVETPKKSAEEKEVDSIEEAISEVEKPKKKKTKKAKK